METFKRNENVNGLNHDGDVVIDKDNGALYLHCGGKERSSENTSNVYSRIGDMMISGDGTLFFGDENTKKGTDGSYLYKI